MNILIFKTNLNGKAKIRKAQPIIGSIKGVQKWNVDLHDQDKILRIEARNVVPLTVENLLQQAGYFCRELED